jgi:glycosyltransferase involved in cell wall biosynthesis
LNAAALPRLLFITPAAFNRTTGGGITFGNLFAGWPKDRLATAHSDPVPTTDETCDTYYRLGPAELRHWGPLERVVSATPRPGELSSAKTNSRRPLLRATRKLLFGQQLPDAGALSAGLERWIERSRPEVLYSILGSNGLMELVLAVQRRFQLPLAVHMMDDWPSAVHRGGLLAPLARRRMQRLLRESFEAASLRLGICDAMSEAYAARYGLPFETFHNAVDASRWKGVERSENPIKDVLYVGSIFAVAQLESLVECCRAVARLAREGVPVRLSIHSPGMYAERYRERLVVSDAIELADTISDDEAFFRRIAAADVLLLPVNFDAATVRYVRYSMPTKLPAYLFSATPILAYGPREVAQVRYVQENGAGVVVAARGADHVAAGLRSLLADRELCRRIGARAHALALERHDLRVVRSRFQSALARVARGRIRGRFLGVAPA